MLGFSIFIDFVYIRLDLLLYHCCYLIHPPLKGKNKVFIEEYEIRVKFVFVKLNMKLKHYLIND